MIYIIGTGHSTQIWSGAVRDGTTDTSAEDVAGFEAFLLDAATALGVVAIAEEMNEEAIGMRPGGSSVAKAVCARLGIRHAFCDPDTAERRRLGIAKEDWAAREAYWWSAMQRLVWPVETLLFVCGACHVDGFSALLAREGTLAQIYCRDWTLLKTAIE